MKPETVQMHAAISSNLQLTPNFSNYLYIYPYNSSTNKTTKHTKVNSIYQCHVIYCQFFFFKKRKENNIEIRFFLHLHWLEFSTKVGIILLTFELHKSSGSKQISFQSIICKQDDSNYSHIIICLLLLYQSILCSVLP